MISDFRKKQQQESLKTLKAIQDLIAKSQFPLGSHNKAKLLSSLSSQGQLNIANLSLLNPEVHAEHSLSMKNGFLRHWKQKKEWGIKRDLSQKNLADQHFRFFTLINSIEIVNEASALSATTFFKEELINHIKKVRGISCLGAIEIEVVSIKHMRRLQELDESNENEQRKLDVCEKLRIHNSLDETHSENMSFLLVHFHGVLSAKKPKDFIDLNNQLRTNPQWGIGPRQIEIKKLSNSYGGRHKSMEDNFSDIARYITKGGNDWVAGKAYLRYKIGYSNDMGLSLQEWESLNWRTDLTLKQEHKEEGIVDILSLTSHEISTLASLIHSVMSLNPNYTGYLIKVGKW